jgi:aerobic carbon-monoxide dehydrogenase medium subunit
MRPARFRYHAPRALDEAVELLGRGEGRVLAGGLSLVPLLRARRHTPAHLVDVNGVEGQRFIQRASGATVVGLAVPQEELRRRLATDGGNPLVAAALALVGTWITRARGTVVGLLAHASPDCELAPVAAVQPIALTAVRGSQRRRVDAAALFSGRDRLAADELAVSATFADLPAHEGWAVLEVTQRALGPAVAGVAVRMHVQEGRCVRVDVAPFGVGAWVGALPDAAAPLVDQPVTEGRIAAVAAAVAELARPCDGLHATGAYRRHALEVLTRRALRLARDRAADRGEGRGTR